MSPSNKPRCTAAGERGTGPRRGRPGGNSIRQGKNRPGKCNDQQKQAFAQMQMAEGSDEQAAASARQVFEGTQIHLSISRDNAQARWPGWRAACRARCQCETIPAEYCSCDPPRTSGNSAVTTVVLSPTSKPHCLAVSLRKPGGRPMS